VCTCANVSICARIVATSSVDIAYIGYVAELRWYVLRCAHLEFQTVEPLGFVSSHWAVCRVIGLCVEPFGLCVEPCGLCAEPVGYLWSHWATIGSCVDPLGFVLSHVGYALSHLG
jgi:hypothetical protein